MYPSSSSSTSHASMGPSGLTRYGSAPSSLLNAAVDSVIGPGSGPGASPAQFGSQSYLGPLFFSGETSPDSTAPNPDPNKGPGLQKCYGLNDIAVADFLMVNNLKGAGAGAGGPSSSSSPLVRHSSLPAGFLNHLTKTPDNGFSLTSGMGNYKSGVGSENGRGVSRLSSQLSFTRQDSLSQISEEESDHSNNNSPDNGNRKSAHSYATASFGMGSWDDTNAIVFSTTPPSKRSKDNHGGFDSLESQFQFGMPQTTLDMGGMENLMHIPQDSVTCKIRAKRGCATHPRSIAERERRTRISGKLKKLQDLVPNMDKQTSYSDMLDLAVQHIKGLQGQVQKLHTELENCTCGCKETS